MGESKLNIKSQFKVTMRIANAIFGGMGREGVNTCRVLFIDRRLYVNSWQSAAAFKLKWPVVFSSLQGRKQERKEEQVLFFLFLLRAYLCTLHTPITFLLDHQSPNPRYSLRLSQGVSCLRTPSGSLCPPPSLRCGSLSSAFLTDGHIHRLRVFLFCLLVYLFPLAASVPLWLCCNRIEGKAGTQSWAKHK